MPPHPATAVGSTLKVKIGRFSLPRLRTSRSPRERWRAIRSVNIWAGEQTLSKADAQRPTRANIPDVRGEVRMENFPRAFHRLLRVEPVRRIDLVRKGLPASGVQAAADYLAISQKDLLSAICIPERSGHGHTRTHPIRDAGLTNAASAHRRQGFGRMQR